MRTQKKVVGLEERVLAWSLGDILNSSYFYPQVGTIIPDKFTSVEDYLKVFGVPLLEEVRAQIHQALQKSMASASTLPVKTYGKVKKLGKNLRVFYDVRILSNPRNLAVHNSDLVLLCNEVPKWDPELEVVIQTRNTFYVLAVVGKEEEEQPFMTLTVYIEDKGLGQENWLGSLSKSTWYAVTLDTGLVPALRIWRALHWPLPPKHAAKPSVIQEILNVQPQPTPSGRDSLDLRQSPKEAGILMRLHAYCNHRTLNESQAESLRSAVSSLLAKEGRLHAMVRVIQGPPGTGKTSMLVSLLSVLGSINCKTLVSAPTNAAVLEICKRVMTSFFDVNAERKQETFSDFCKNHGATNTPQKLRGVSAPALSALILVGSKKRLGVVVMGNALEKVFLPERVERLSKALNPLTGWKSTIQAVEKFLKEAPSQHKKMLESQRNERTGKLETPGPSGWNNNTAQTVGKKTKSTKKERRKLKEVTSFWTFVKRTMATLHGQMKYNCHVLTTELPRVHLDVPTSLLMISACDLMTKLMQILPSNIPTDVSSWFSASTSIDALTEGLSRTHLVDGRTSDNIKWSFLYTRIQLLEVLGRKPGHVFFKSAKYPEGRRPSPGWLKADCVQHACLVFSTVSSAGGPLLQDTAFDCAIIDEASQLVEAETTIITRRTSLKQLILVGDHKQLPATVISQAAEKCGYGRSLFDRLQAAQHGCRHLLNLQYRMSPSISSFPNSQFYGGELRDGANVLQENYGRYLTQYCSYGAYAFLDCRNGCEVTSNKSFKNPREAQIVGKLVSDLHKSIGLLDQAFDAGASALVVISVCAERNFKDLSIGVISPYATQVEELKQCLRIWIHDKRLNIDVKTVDGFQGNERDVIIFSAVRANRAGRIGFVDDFRRLNVAITRARHCLLIVGNARTLSRGGDVWKDLIKDAKTRNLVHAVD